MCDTEITFEYKVSCINKCCISKIVSNLSKFLYFSHRSKHNNIVLYIK